MRSQDLGVTYHEDTFDPKALWLNAEHIRSLPIEDLSQRLLPIVRSAGFNVTPEKMLRITPLIRERIKLLRDVLTAADFFFVDQLPPYDPAELIPQKGDAAMAKKVLDKAQSRTRQCRVQARSAGSGPARRRPGTRHQGRTDVPAHPRSSLRPQKRPAAVRNVRSLGPRNNIGADRPGDSLT